MGDGDFRPGDPVTFITSERNAVIGHILTNDVPGSDIVRFKADCSMSVYAVYKNGKLSKYGGPRVLYHGHNVQVQITGEEKPVRTVSKWVNIELRPDGILSNHVYSTLHNSIEATKYSKYSHFVAVGVEIEIPEDRRDDD